ncbi:MAG: YdcF family protein [Clostridia bacterium]|nr:YdcF family protein [Clostridia bacterium]
MKNIKKILKRMIVGAIIATAVAVALFVAVNIYVISFSSKYILTPEKAAELEGVECIAVLGAHVRDDGSPSLMLQSRLEKAIMLYENGVSAKMLMTGDHGQHEYDEVNNMMDYVLENSDIPKDNVFLDHAGFSTYESAYRAKAVFEVEKAVFVTQTYHLYRAVYNARKCGIEAYGVASDSYSWPGMVYYKFRESFAIFKDFWGCVFNVKPKYLGEIIPVSGSSAASHDR